MNSRFTVEYEDLAIKRGQDDTSNSVDRNSVAGGIDNDFNNEQTTEVVNGGPGSGNFGHSGRPGEVGGSSSAGSKGVPKENFEKVSGKTVADRIYDDPRGKYSDGFDNLARTKEFIIEHAGEYEGLGEDIAMAYEDDARDTLGLPSRDEENEGAELAYSDLAEISDYITETIQEKSFEDLEKDLGKSAIDSAVDCALRQGGLEYALGNSKLGQSGLSHDDAVRDLKSFIADFGVVDHYGAIKAAESGDFKTAWRDIAYDLSDSIDDEFGRKFGRGYFEQLDK